jgi:anti-sigma factor RsiW
MTTILHNLESQEAVLLMYLADELSEPDRAEVERQLAANPAMRVELDVLRRINEQILSNLDTLDSSERIPTIDASTIHRLSREMVRHQVELTMRSAAPAPTWQSRSWPWWAYPVASVAAAVFLVIGLWGFRVIDWEPGRMAIRGDRVTTSDPYPAIPTGSEAIFAELTRSMNVRPTRLEDAEAQLHTMQIDEDESLLLPTL